MEGNSFLQNGCISNNGLSNGHTQQRPESTATRRRHELIPIPEGTPMWKKALILKKNDDIRKRNEEIEREEKAHNKYSHLPEWKQDILKIKEAQRSKQQQLEQEEKEKRESMQAEWDKLQPWQQELLRKKGCHPLKRRVSVPEKEKPVFAIWAANRQSSDSDNSSGTSPDTSRSGSCTSTGNNTPRDAPSDTLHDDITSDAVE